MWCCDRCKEWRFDSFDKCHCKEFNIVDDQGDLYTVWATGRYEAALAFAEESNETGDYHLLDYPATITVDGCAYQIRAEQSIDYHVKRVDGEDDE